MWESIADSFDRNRQRTWPHVERFLDQRPPGTLVLDLMGGNGRHVGPILSRGLAPLWLDWSRPASRIVARRYRNAHAVCGDATRLPIASDSVPAALWVAGLHSLPTEATRDAALGELARVLAPGGVAQITVWSRLAPRFALEGDPSQCLDVVLPWRSDGHDAPRHYHLYTPQALRAAVERAGLAIERAYDVAVVAQDPDNLVVEVRRA